MDSQTVRTAALVWVGILAFASMGNALTQEPAATKDNGVAARPRPVANAAEVVEAPVIDWYLDEELWQFAPLLTGFVQADPQEGAPAW